MAAHLIATVRGGTIDQYDEASAKLMGSGMPAGLLHHVCVPTDDGFMVIETWESEKALEDFTGSERFQQTLAGTGMPMPELQVRPVHNLQASE
jgi:hypothetical protein